MDIEWFTLRAGLKRHLSRFFKRPEDVEDIVQESFVRVLEAASKGEISYPKAYLYRTGRNLALTTLASLSHRLEETMGDDIDIDAVIAEAASPEEQVIAQRRFELFCRATATLPEQCRRVVILRKVYGLSQQEVAERLNISVGTVDKHLAKGLMHCVAFMDNQETQRASDAKTARRRKQP